MRQANAVIARVFPPPYPLGRNGGCEAHRGRQQRGCPACQRKGLAPRTARVSWVRERRALPRKCPPCHNTAQLAAKSRVPGLAARPEGAFLVQFGSGSFVGGVTSIVDGGRPPSVACRSTVCVSSSAGSYSTLGPRASTARDRWRECVLIVTSPSRVQVSKLLLIQLDDFGRRGSLIHCVGSAAIGKNGLSTDRKGCE